MIVVAIGSNLPAPGCTSPAATCAAALSALQRADIRIIAQSRWYESAPVPWSDQPNFINGVAAVETQSPPSELLAALHRIEAAFGRVRHARNEARVLDLDLVAYHDLVRAGHPGPILPHPRMHERAFVLLPLADIAPDWVHPVSGRSVGELIAALPPGQVCAPLPQGG